MVDPLQQYFDAVQARYHDTTALYAELVDHIATERNQASRVETAKKLRASLDTMELVIPSPHRPAWVGTLRTAMVEYLSDPSNIKRCKALLNTLLDLHKDVTTQDWEHLKRVEQGIDFGEIYSRYYDGSELPRLLDELLDTLQRIVASDLIDDRYLERRLQAFVAIIRRNRTGNWLSVKGIVLYGRAFFANLTKEALKEVKEATVLRVIFNAAEKTFEEAEAEAVRVEKMLREEIDRTVERTVLPSAPALMLTAREAELAANDPDIDMSAIPAALLPPAEREEEANDDAADEMA